MAKRGRKPSNKRKGYFYEEQEEAVKNYLKAETKEEKDKIFKKWLEPAFEKMITSIIRRYNLYPPDENFQDTFDDTVSFLMTKIECFKPDSGYKAYSYCGTICKNYLIYKINQFNKNQKRNERYDMMQSDISDSIKFSYDDDSNNISFLTKLMNNTVKKINDIIDKREKFRLSEDEIKVGKALIELMNNWEDLFAQMGSDKFNKSSILLFLKETTLLNTKQIRDGMKKYKTAYYGIKSIMINS
nr:MAG TPA: Sigma-70 region 2 [Caudoviricetes sp.]